MVIISTRRIHLVTLDMRKAEWEKVFCSYFKAEFIVMIECGSFLRARPYHDFFFFIKTVLDLNSSVTFFPRPKMLIKHHKEYFK